MPCPRDVAPLGLALAYALRNHLPRVVQWHALLFAVATSASPSIPASAANPMLLLLLLPLVPRPGASSRCRRRWRCCWRWCRPPGVRLVRHHQHDVKQVQREGAGLRDGVAYEQACVGLWKDGNGPRRVRQRTLCRQRTFYQSACMCTPSCHQGYARAHGQCYRTEMLVVRWEHNTTNKLVRCSSLTAATASTSLCTDSTSCQASDSLAPCSPPSPPPSVPDGPAPGERRSDGGGCATAAAAPSSCTARRLVGRARCAGRRPEARTAG